jgi:hypothetical protein
MKTLSRKLFLSTIIPFCAVLLSSSVLADTGQVEYILLSEHPAGNYVFVRVDGISGSSFCYHVGQGSDLGAALMVLYTAQIPLTISCGTSGSFGPINSLTAMR